MMTLKEIASCYNLSHICSFGNDFFNNNGGRLSLQSATPVNTNAKEAELTSFLIPKRA